MDAACKMSARYSSALTLPVQGAQHRPRCWFRHGLSFPMSRGKTREQVARCNASLIVSMALKAAFLPMYGPKYRAPSSAGRETTVKRG